MPPDPLALECGAMLYGVQIAYHAYGALNAAGNNAIWICHALTANSDAADWWQGMVGRGLVFDTSRYYVVCANIIGSCYGSTGPLSVNPLTQKPYYRTFPQVTMRDMAAAHNLLRLHLGIPKIKVVVGGSIGAFQALEWCIMQPEAAESLVFIAAGACASPWAAALGETQRMAIEADPTFFEDTPAGGGAGLAAARAVAMLSYRGSRAYNLTQADPDNAPLGIRRACSYQRHQGGKLVRRFSAHSYHCLTRALDSHDAGRARSGGIERVLRNINIPALIVGIESDILFPPQEQQYMANIMPHSVLRIIASHFGHDGFLIENSKLTLIIREFLDNVVK